MNNQKQKIQKLSRVVCKLITAAFVIFIIVGVMQIISYAVIKYDLPYIFKLGNMHVVLPVILTNNINIGDTSINIPEFLQNNMLGIAGTVITLIILSFAKKFFKLLRDDGTPFREDVVNALHKMAIALCVLGIFNGIEVLLAALVVYVLSLIFEYGCTLQNEIDTTL